ncbi:iron ABC transporter substrate-binding protein [Haloplanus aerogenes]|uniref:Iron ABC transporter substrate-binding protein n=1 Tax=Haloplanus aerogenes TaxID=660522 RepID=A0A3M0CYZ9_9EURY|nr:iron ABC transporter substrate-binding protein [Haloplanus aerogenes]AZH26595.1 iron ABC transporter substrate-binding protein [Haloplanus aerogenes]RMB12826.1 iron(III) transport system substrate-binding protein [Haloplanus aerogenes]
MDDDSSSYLRRRRFLATGAAALSGALAGCNGLPGGSSGGGGGDGSGTITLSSFRGSGPLVEGRASLSGTRIADLPDLSGELTVYLGGGEGGLYRELLSMFSQLYPDFTVRPREGGTAQLANTIIEEGENSPADVFWAVDAGSLGAVAEADMATTLSSDVVESVPQEFHPTDQWVGTAGRARSVPYNTNELSASDIPDTVMDFPDTPALQGAMGWAPTYGAFQAFVTAMRLIEGESATRQWLQSMLDSGVTEYPDEFLTSNAVADGEISAGFANHYYALRVRSARTDAPLDLAFTSGDAGALINVAGAAVIQGTDQQELAENFVRHLLTVEAQEFFATRTFAYPMIPGVPPVGGLPSIDELNPPSIDLQELSNVEPTLQLMRDVGVL